MQNAFQCPDLCLQCLPELYTPVFIIYEMIQGYAAL